MTICNRSPHFGHCCTKYLGALMLQNIFYMSLATWLKSVWKIPNLKNSAMIGMQLYSEGTCIPCGSTWQLSPYLGWKCNYNLDMWLVWINPGKWKQRQHQQLTTSKGIGHLIRKDLPSKYELNFYSSGLLLNWVVTNFLEILDSIFFGTRSVPHEY